MNYKLTLETVTDDGFTAGRKEYVIVTDVDAEGIDPDGLLFRHATKILADNFKLAHPTKE